MAEKKFYLFERMNASADGSGYSFFIEGSFLDVSQKVTFVFVKRGKQNKREDLAKFFLDYRKFRSVITIMYNRIVSGKANYEESFYGGDDGKRRLVFKLIKEPKKPTTIFINVYDNLIQKEHKDYNKYTGKLMFSLKGALDFQEFFDLRTTLNNWEILKIGKLVRYDPPKTETNK